MPVTTRPFTNWMLAAAVLVPLACAWAHFSFAAPLISHDSAIGWQTWRSMQAGAAWNHIQLPDPADIARSHSGFLAWWTPGQYLPLGLFTALGLSLGNAALLTSLLSAWALAFGLWRLCLALGSSSRAAALAGLAAATTWHTLYAFGYFIGGEIVLIAVWPWICLGAWRTRERPLLQLAVLPLLLLIGSFAKLSFSITAAGLLLFLWLESARDTHWQPRATVIAGARLAAAGAIYAAVWYWLHLSRGETPASTGLPGASAASILGFGFVGPWFSTIGFSSIFGRICFHFGIESDIGWEKVAYGLLALGALGAIGSALLLKARNPLARLAGCVALVAGLAFIALLFRGGNVSLEDRHFRPAGVLLLAVVAAVAADSSRVKSLRLAAIGTVAFAILFGLAATGQRLLNLRTHSVRAHNGIASTTLDRAGLESLAQSDRPGALIYLTDMMQAPLVSQARTFVVDIEKRDRAWLAAQSWRGRVPHLVLVLPENFEIDGRGAAIRSSFKDYASDAWKQSRAGGWDFWEATSP